MYNIFNYLIAKVEQIWKTQSQYRSKDNWDRRTSDTKLDFVEVDQQTTSLAAKVATKLDFVDAQSDHQDMCESMNN